VRGERHAPVARRRRDIDLGAITHSIGPSLEFNERFFKATAKDVIGKQRLFSLRDGGLA
jgi:hypothetical protein